MMGYITDLMLVGVSVPRKRFAAFRRSLEQHRDDEDCPFGWVLRYVYLSSSEDGDIDWNLSEESRDFFIGASGEEPTPLGKISRRTKQFFVNAHGPEGTCGKWYQTENLVTWLSEFCSAGRIIQVSQEGDGTIWGWELRGDGRVRDLGLAPVGRWHKPRYTKDED
jgi:hypothetical protein